MNSTKPQFETSAPVQAIQREIAHLRHKRDEYAEECLIPAQETYDQATAAFIAAEEAIDTARATQADFEEQILKCQQALVALGVVEG